MATHKLLLLPGDGIGPEIMEATLHVLKEAGADISIETIEVGERTVRVRASVADPDERRRLYDIQADLYPGFKGYGAGTERVIPVVVLTPRP